MASASQKWSSPETAISLGRTWPLWVIIIIIIFSFISEIQKAFMQKVRVSCDKRVLNPIVKKLQHFLKNKLTAKLKKESARKSDLSWK